MGSPARSAPSRQEAEVARRRRAQISEMTNSDLKKELEEKDVWEMGSLRRLSTSLDREFPSLKGSVRPRTKLHEATTGKKSFQKQVVK